jgi:hypothetical protein
MIKVVMALVAFERLDGHAEITRRFPRINPTDCLTCHPSNVPEELGSV